MAVSPELLLLPQTSGMAPVLLVYPSCRWVGGTLLILAIRLFCGIYRSLSVVCITSLPPASALPHGGKNYRVSRPEHIYSTVEAVLGRSARFILLELIGGETSFLTFPASPRPLLLGTHCLPDVSKTKQMLLAG